MPTHVAYIHMSQSVTCMYATYDSQTVSYIHIVIKRYYMRLPLVTCMYPRVAPYTEVGGVEKACLLLGLRTKNRHTVTEPSGS